MESLVRVERMGRAKETLPSPRDSSSSSSHGRPVRSTRNFCIAQPYSSRSPRISDLTCCKAASASTTSCTIPSGFTSAKWSVPDESIVGTIRYGSGMPEIELMPGMATVQKEMGTGCMLICSAPAKLAFDGQRAVHVQHICPSPDLGA
jgi:hypothetical protein